MVSRAKGVVEYLYNYWWNSEKMLAQIKDFSFICKVGLCLQTTWVSGLELDVRLDAWAFVLWFVTEPSWWQIHSTDFSCTGLKWVPVRNLMLIYVEFNMHDILMMFSPPLLLWYRKLAARMMWTVSSYWATGLAWKAIPGYCGSSLIHHMW